MPSAPSSFTPPSAPTGSTAGLEDLAAFIASNYMGMGKSAADALPELRRKGIMSVGGGNFSIAGRAMDAAGIAQALRLQVRIGALCIRRRCKVMCLSNVLRL